MGRLVWTGDLLWDLLNLSWGEFRLIHPDVKKNTYKGKRVYWNTKLREGKISMPPRPEQEPQLVTTWEAAKRGEDGAWDITTLHKYDHKPQPQVADFISQADPIKLTPSKRRPIKRDHRLILAFGDSQIDYRYIDGDYVPTHDERALEVVTMMCRELQPDTIVNLGDTIDLAALSRFDKDSNHYNNSMQPAINRVHKLYASMRQNTPNSRIVEVDSNHNTRLKKFFMKHNPELAYLRQPGNDSDYPVFSYAFLANLGAVGVEWVSGYGAAEFVYGEEYDAPPIVFKHGTLTGRGVAHKESAANPYTHIVRGHSHRPEMANRTMRNGHYLTYMVVGVTCSVTGDVPSVYSAVDDRGHVVRQQEQWQQSVGIIEDYQDGTYNFINILINNGVAKYNGKLYDARSKE